MNRARLKALLASAEAGDKRLTIQRPELIELCQMALRALEYQTGPAKAARRGHEAYQRSAQRRRVAIVEAASKHGQAEAARMFGISRQAVHQYVKDAKEKG